MPKRRSAALPALALLVATAAPAAAVPTLVVAGVAAPLELTPELLHRLPRQKISLPATEHRPAASFEGVRLRDLLSEARVPTGTALRGEYVAWEVVAEAADGYRAVFALAELDPAFADRVVLVADTRDGRPLDAREAPIRLVVPDDHRPARGARQVTRLTVGPAAPALCPAENEILLLESAWNEAHLRGDVAALDRLWASELTVIVPEMGAFTKENLLAMWRSTRVAFSAYATSEVRVHCDGPSVVVTGRLRRSRDFGGKTRDEDWRFTKIYARRDGEWKVVLYHALTNPGA